MEQKYMEMALAIARENMTKKFGGPFGAVVVKNGKVIASSCNHVIKNNDPTAHAEVLAIREACSKLKSHQLEGCEIYSSCEPCPMCLGAIYWARPSKVYYSASRLDAAKAGFDDNHIYQELKTNPEHRKIPTIQVDNESGKKVFEEWEFLNTGIHY